MSTGHEAWGTHRSLGPQKQRQQRAEWAYPQNRRQAHRNAARRLLHVILPPRSHLRPSSETAAGQAATLRHLLRPLAPPRAPSRPLGVMLPLTKAEVRQKRGPYVTFSRSFSRMTPKPGIGAIAYPRNSLTSAALDSTRVSCDFRLEMTASFRACSRWSSSMGRVGVGRVVCQ